MRPRLAVEGSRVSIRPLSERFARKREQAGAPFYFSAMETTPPKQAIGSKHQSSHIVCVKLMRDIEGNA